jgi:hypothetical protein
MEEGVAPAGRSVSRKWSSETVPITLDSHWLVFWVLKPVVWLGLTWIVWWLLLHPRPSTAEAVVFGSCVVVFGPFVWLVKLFRGTHRSQIRITSDGIAVQQGGRIEASPFITCSLFKKHGLAIQWDVDGVYGTERRGFGGLFYGLSPRDIGALVDLINELRARTLAK